MPEIRRRSPFLSAGGGGKQRDGLCRMCVFIRLFSIKLLGYNH